MSSRSSGKRRHRDRDRDSDDDNERSHSKRRKHSKTEKDREKNYNKDKPKRKSRFAEAAPPVVKETFNVQALDAIQAARNRARAAAAAIAKSVASSNPVNTSSLNQSLAQGVISYQRPANQQQQAMLLAQEALEKARRAALIQQQIQRSLEASTRAIAVQNATSKQQVQASKGYLPAPLILDDKGRQVDTTGRVLETGVRPVTTLKVNIKTQKKVVNPYLSHRTGEDNSEAFDERLKTVNRKVKATKAFKFVEEGRYVKKADALRARDERKAITASMRRSDVRVHLDMYDTNLGMPQRKTDVSEFNSNMIALQGRTILAPEVSDDAVPEVEWW
jgi:hypothetical protein